MRRFLLAALVLGAAPLAAQDLAEVRRLSQQGQPDSARAMLQQVLAATPPASPAYAELLYLSGNLATTAPPMRLAFQRVVTEYGRSEWADDALLRLAQVDYAQGDYAGAVAQVERLRADYPGSPLLGMAALWGARAWFARNNTAAGCVMLADGMARAGQDVELRNQLSFYQARCGRTPPAVAAADTVRRPPPEPVREEVPAPVPVEPEPTPAPAPASGPVYRVQLVAAGTAATAQQVATRARNAGYEAVVVAEGGYHKVRAGAWPTRAEAAAALPALRELVGGSPFVVRDP